MSEDEAISSPGGASSSLPQPQEQQASSSSSSHRRPPPPPPPPRRRRPSVGDQPIVRAKSPPARPTRPRLGPAPPPPETRRSPSPGRMVLPPLPPLEAIMQEAEDGLAPRMLSPVPTHSPLLSTRSLSPNPTTSPPFSPPQQPPLELEPGVPPPPLPGEVHSPPRPASPDPFSRTLSPPTHTPPLPPPPADPPPSNPSLLPQTPQPTTRPPPILIPPKSVPSSSSNPNPASEAASLQGIPYPSDDMFLDSENLSTLEKIFLFARSDAAYHRLFVARTLPEWLPSVEPGEAVEYILPLLNGLGTDSEETVRETFAPALPKVMWYFFTTCNLTEDEAPFTPSVHSDAEGAPGHTAGEGEQEGEGDYPPGPPTISVSSFTPLLGSLLLSVNRNVGESARWGVVQVLQKLKEEEDLELHPPSPPPASKRKARELEKEKKEKWEGWVSGRAGKEKRDMIRRELILGVVLGMARLEEEEDAQDGEEGEGGEDGEDGETSYDEGEMEEMKGAARRERQSQREGSRERSATGWQGRSAYPSSAAVAAAEAEESDSSAPAASGPETETDEEGAEGDDEAGFSSAAWSAREDDISPGAVSVGSVGSSAMADAGHETDDMEVEPSYTPRSELGELGSPRLGATGRLRRQEEEGEAVGVELRDFAVEERREGEEEAKGASVVERAERDMAAASPSANSAEETVPEPIDSPEKAPASATEPPEAAVESTRASPLPQAQGSTTFLLHPMSPRSIALFELREMVEAEIEEELHIPGSFPPVAPKPEPAAPTVAPKTSPSPPQQSDEDTPAMTIGASPADSNESPSAPTVETRGSDPDSDSESEAHKVDTQAFVGLVAQASELGMAMMSPNEAEAVSPLHRSDDDTPTSPAFTPSDSGSTVQRVSPNPPFDEDEGGVADEEQACPAGIEEAEEERVEDVTQVQTRPPVTPPTAILVSPPLEGPTPAEYFPSPPIHFPPPQQPVTPSFSPPDWLPVPPSPDVTGQTSQDLPAKASPLALIASLALMSAIASSSALPPPDLEGHFLPELLRIASQADEWVRREAGFVIGALAKAVSPEVVRSDLVPLLQQFSTDVFWHVRHSSLFSAPPILSRLNPDERRNLALEIFLAAATDPSRAVKSACLELLGEAIATFKDDPNGPPDELIQLFLGDPNDRPEDNDSDLDSPLEWYSTPGLGLKPVPRSKRDADRCLVCAFNFPAVALTLGRDRWPVLRDYYLYLARDKSLKVRRTLASSLGALAEIIGPEAARRDLIQVWKRAFEAGPDGFVDEDVVGWAIESIEGLCKAVDGDFPREVVESLQEWWGGIMAKRWRLREQIAIKLPVLAQHWAQVEGVPQGLRVLLGLALTDDVAAVRESAAEGVSGICAALRNGPGEEALRDELLKLSEHPSFRYRMTFIACIQSLLADEMKDDLHPLWPRVWALGSDPVVDVRISVARLVATAVGMDTFFRDPSSRPHMLNTLIRKLTQDKSYQVRSFVAFLRGTHNVTPVTTPVRGASLMSPSAKFSRPPLVLSPGGSMHDEPEEMKDDRAGMDDTKEFYSAIARNRDAPLPVFTLPQSPRHWQKVETPSTEPAAISLKPVEAVREDPAERKDEPEEGQASEDESYEEALEEEEDPNDPFADSMSAEPPAATELSVEFEEDADV